jgi:ABC-type bacteriocin/lantibiotic exporter with double-glycine peptidase domain
LTPSQRQKLVLARSLMKRPDVLILSEATAALDTAAQESIMANLLKEYAGRSLIWSLQSAELAANFDTVVVMSAGKVIEQGAYADLEKSGAALPALLAGKSA